MLLEDEKRMTEDRIKRMRGQQRERPSDTLEGSRMVMPGATGHGVTRQLRQEFDSNLSKQQ